jgi:TonB family protein
MIAQWMFYTVLVSVLLSAAALLTEGALLRHRVPVRAVWVAAIAGALVVPVLAAWRAWGREAEVVAGGLLIGEPTAAGNAVASGGASGWVLDPGVLLALDGPLLVLWLVGTATLVSVLTASHLDLRRRRRGWRPAVVGGMSVWISPDTGPAVLGIRRGIVVVPAWIERLAAGQQRLLLAHEEEHLRAGDPRILFAGLGLLVLMPWNPALWWQLRRLRSAIEIDCDRRVLHRFRDVGEYGSLLIEVGRRSTRMPLAAAAFSEQPSQLERRIRMLVRPRDRRGWMVSAWGVAAAAAVVLGSCEVEPPETISLLGDSSAESADSTGVGGIELPATNNSDREPGSATAEAAGDSIEGEETEVVAGDDRLRGRQIVLPSAPAPADRQTAPTVEELARNRRTPQSTTTVPTSGVDATAASGPEVRPSATQTAGADAEPQFTPTEVRPQLRNTNPILQQMEQRYPPMFRDAGIGGTTILWVDVGADGQVLDTRVQSSSGYPELDQVAQEVMREASFSPAQNRDVPVRVWIQIPLTFRVD